MRWSANGKMLASPAGKFGIKVWDVQTGKCLLTLKGHTNYVTSVTFSPDGSRLASSSRDKTVRIWDVSTGASLAVLKDHPHALQDVAWSYDGQFIAVAGEHGSLVIWNAISLELAHAPSRTESILTISIAWTSDSTRLAAASFKTSIFDKNANLIQQLTSTSGLI